MIIIYVRYILYKCNGYYDKIPFLNDLQSKNLFLCCYIQKHHRTLVT